MAANLESSTPREFLDDSNNVMAFAEQVGARIDRALENRNQFIEWTFGIVGVILVGGLLAYPTFPLATWAASALSVTLVAPLLQLAVKNHAAYRQLGVVHQHLLRLGLKVDDDSFPEFSAHVKNVVKELAIIGRVPETKRSLYANLLRMGYVYLGLAALATFVLVSWGIVFTGVPHADQQTQLGVLCGSAIVVGVLLLQLIYILLYDRVDVYKGPSTCPVCRLQFFGKWYSRIPT